MHATGKGEGGQHKGQGEDRYHAWDGWLGFRLWFGFGDAVIGLEPTLVLLGWSVGVRWVAIEKHNIFIMHDNVTHSIAKHNPE